MLVFGFDSFFKKLKNQKKHILAANLIILLKIAAYLSSKLVFREENSREILNYLLKPFKVILLLQQSNHFILPLNPQPLIISL